VNAQHSQPAQIFQSILDRDGQTATPANLTAFLRFYEMVLHWNPRLHLTTITDPEGFARRHLGEALEVERRIRNDVTELWDIGSGLGIPGIPVAIRRPNLTVRLVESNRKKSIFLEEVARELKLDLVNVINDRFSGSHVPQTACITARAVERMDRMVTEILQSGSRQMILIGAESLISTPLPGWSVEKTSLDVSGRGYIFDCRRL